MSAKTNIVVMLAVGCLLAIPQTGFTQSGNVWDRADALKLTQQVIELNKQGRYSEAVPSAERALSILEGALGPDHPDVATSLNNLGLLYQNLGQYSAAESLYKRSLAIKERVLGPNHLDVSATLNNLANLCRELRPLRGS
jgi:tetratricopeptide (TPR) repeat protein